MFEAVLTNIKRTGKGPTQHKDVITDADMTTLYSSGILNRKNPQGLQYKVFIDVMFYTCRREREHLGKLKKTDIVLRTDGQGRRYYLNVAQYETKKITEEVMKMTMMHLQQEYMIYQVLYCTS